MLEILIKLHWKNGSSKCHKKTAKLTQNNYSLQDDSFQFNVFIKMYDNLMYQNSSVFNIFVFEFATIKKIKLLFNQN